ncbi:hypothetical protein HOY82DRAFT_607352 [Tuber indicum]|nr:hypothetical protein HOY82DRAFT_607352 [Tuber indicum]
MDPGNSASNSTVTPLSEAAEEYSACLDALRKTGCYNETRDGDFISNMTPGKGIGTTTTTLSWETTKPMNGFSLEGLPVNIIYEGVLGGFDEGPIGHEHKAVFSKANVNFKALDVAVTWVKYIGGGGGGGKETEVYNSPTGSTQIALSYNSSQLRLPPDTLTPLLPH